MLQQWLRSPDLDPARDGIHEREMIEDMQGKLHNALLRLENIQSNMQRLEACNAYLEGELKLQGQHQTNALKRNIVFKQQLAELQKPRSNKAKRRCVISSTAQDC